jgi:hypothetical protein
MLFRLILFVTTLTCLSSNVLAQHSDLEFGYDDTSNPSAFVLSPLSFDATTADGISLNESVMEELDPFTSGDFSADQPGFASNPGQGLSVNPGDFIMICAVDASQHSSFGVGFVNFYNPATDALEASGRIAVKDNSGATADLVLNGNAIESGDDLQFIGVADSTGTVHDHIVWDLLDDATAPVGAYGLLVQLQSDFDPVDGNEDLSSEPFWIVFNYGMTDSDFENLALTKFGVLTSGSAVLLERGVTYGGSSFLETEFAPDKIPLLPGQTAAFANYTSYSKGLNRVAFDIFGIGSPTLDSNDFEFRVGNSDDPSTWTQLTTSSTIPLPTISVGTAVGGISPVLLSWPDNAIENAWLQVVVLDTANTNLSSPETFYFGNAIGEAGNDPNDARVNLIDVGQTRSNQTGFTGALIDNAFDFDRDGRVNLIDVGLCRSNQSGFSPLQLISPPANRSNGGGSGKSIDGKNNSRIKPNSKVNRR